MYVMLSWIFIYPLRIIDMRYSRDSIDQFLSYVMLFTSLKNLDFLRMINEFSLVLSF